MAKIFGLANRYSLSVQRTFISQAFGLADLRVMRAFGLAGGNPSLILKSLQAL